MTDTPDKEESAPKAAGTPRPPRRRRRPAQKPKTEGDLAGTEAESPKTAPDSAAKDATVQDASETKETASETVSPNPNVRRRTRNATRPKAATAAVDAGAPPKDAEDVAPPEAEKPPSRTRRAKPASSQSVTPASDEPTDDSPKAKPIRRKRRGGRRSGGEKTYTPKGPRTMLISVGSDRIQIAALEGRELIEHYVAHTDDRSIVGNVYLGRVQNVLPGMEAAFLDIGESRNAVLYAGEVGFDEDIEGPPPRIETMLKSGQPVLAQVTKDPMGSKGARLTTEVSIAGRYLVLVPEADSLGISRRLSDDERRRLRDITSAIKPDGYGVIVRTAAEGAVEDDLRRDINRLVRIWTEVSAKSKKAKPPKLIYSEPDLAIRVIRDLFTGDVEKVIVDDEKVFQEIKDYLDEIAPDLSDRIERHTGALPLFEEHHVVEQIRKAVDRRVWLKSGGHIVIDRTEALTVIDVNTGRFVGKSNLEETVLHANLEAAEEVAKQLRLRDIGGIIVIDFIDMLHERNRDELVKVFRDALGRDKTRTQVFGVSELGLIQMTRKKVSEGLLEAFSHRCEACEGRGLILTDIVE